MLGTLRIGKAVLAGALLLFPLAQTRTDEYLSKFAHESNPVRRAKLMPKLGDSEFGDIEKDVTGGNLDAAVLTLRQYRDQAEACMKDLDAHDADAERHPSGFKELQISLRESLRRLDNVLPNLTGDEQKPFLDLRKDIDQMNRHVIQELFPRHPDTGGGPVKPKS